MRMELYAARDRGGELYLYEKKPLRCVIQGFFTEVRNSDSMNVPGDLLPELTWENSPAEVTVDLQFKNKKSNP